MLQVQSRAAARHGIALRHRLDSKPKTGESAPQRAGALLALLSDVLTEAAQHDTLTGATLEAAHRTADRAAVVLAGSSVGDDLHDYLPKASLHLAESAAAQVLNLLGTSDGG